MTVGREQDHSLVCLNIGQLLSLEVGWVVVKPSVLASEAAPYPLQPCFFDKWNLFADTWDCQYAMGFPVCIFKYLGVSLHNFIPIFPIS